MDIIHLLPDGVANQIAAGEVVQRPSSVIKELVENSVDAGADRIEIWVTDAGKTSIMVIDNGKGMSETDARMAFERHATSNISQAADLYNLHTLGFRGEALASIAAVAQVELTTKTIDDELGVHLVLKGQQIVEQSPVACNRGAKFVVNNLFYNVPARRRFLKSDVTEMKNIFQEFERIALIHPDIEFAFYKEDVLSISLKTGTFKRRIIEMYGNTIEKQLLPVQADTSLVKIDAYVGMPESAKTKGARQFFFVNGRYMKHSYFNRAIQSAFERLIPSDKSVPYFYCLEVDPSRIDVNIHPTKTEIKFADEQAIWQIIFAATKEALGTFNVVPPLDFEPSAIPEISLSPSRPISQPHIEVDNSYNPFNSSKGYTRTSAQDWQKFYQSFASVGQKETAMEKNAPITEAMDNRDLFADEASESVSVEWERETSLFFQYGKYIFTPVQSGLMMIDMHHAHMRILYDAYLENLVQGDGISQGLLFPELFQLSISQIPVIQKLWSELKSVGFEISDLGGGSYAINGVPAGIEKRRPVEVVHSLLDKYGENGSSREAVHSSLALELARNNAIPASQKLSNDEMNHLVSQLLQLQGPKYAPDGKPIITLLDMGRLDALMR